MECTKESNQKEAETIHADGDIETYTFTTKETCQLPLLYCCSLPKLNTLNMAESLKLLETIDIEGRLCQGNSKKRKIEEEIKSHSIANPCPKLRLDAVRAAIKVALKCKKGCGYELMQGFASNMQSLASDMGVLNGITHLLPKIPLLLDEEGEDLQMKVLEQTSDICAFVMKNKIGYESVVGTVIPKLQQMIHNISKKISDKAVEVMLKIAQKLTDDDRGKHILTDVLRLAHDEEDDDSRIIAVQLLSKFAEIFGTELCEQFVTHEIMSLAEDPSFKVRKAAAEHLVSICKVVAPATFTQKMFPLYCVLAGDTIWGVRKAAADNIVEIAKLASLEIRLTTLSQIILTLLQDISQWVQKAAVQRLGQFIATLIPSIIPTSLIDSYASMAVAKSEDEEEVIYQCAYNFPAVIYACGKELWGKLKKIYLSLWEIDIDKVTFTLCSSIHEVGKVLGPEIAAAEITPIMLEHLQDIGMNTLPLLTNAGDILAFSSDESKDEFLEILQNLHEESGKKWRIRDTIAKHIFEYAKAYKPIQVFKRMWGLVTLLCTDDVSQVRNSAATNLWKIFEYCKDEEFVEMMKSDIIGLSMDSKWNTRQTFAAVCNEMWQAPELFEASFLSAFIGMAKDPIVSVRLSFSCSLKNIISKSEKLASNALIKQAQIDIQKDPSARVKEQFVFKVKTGILTEEVKSVNLIGEEEASKIDITSIEKEIEQEGAEKIEKMPVGIKIDEVDSMI